MTSHETNPDEWPLSGSQRLIWIGQQLQPDQPIYNMALAFEIQGPIDPALFQLAFQTLVDHCDALRLVIVGGQQQPRQRFLEQFTYRLEQFDFSQERQPQQAYRDWLNCRVARQFDLSRCLFDSGLIKLAEDRFVWYFNQHHIATDATATSILYRSMQRIYALAREKRLENASRLPSYRNYIKHELKSLESPQYRHAQTYWRKKLRKSFPPTQFYRRTPRQRSAETIRIQGHIGKSRYNRLKQRSEEPGFTAFTMDLSVFQIFLSVLFAYLYRISGNHILSVGAPTHNRVSPEFRKTAGLFIELFPVYAEIEDHDTFQSLYDKVSRDVQQVLMNTAAGLSTEQHHQIFDVVLNFITASFGDFDSHPMKSEWIHAGYGDHNHLLRLQIHNFDEADDYLLHFDLNCDTFVGDERSMVIEHFLCLLDAFLEDPNQRIGPVPLLRRDQMPRFSAPVATKAASEQTIVDLFYLSVGQYGDCTALFCQASQLSSAKLSYTELNRQSNRLARALIDHGIERGAVIALCMDRSIEMVVAVLGVLKSGSAYLPIDDGYPEERIRFILEDSSAQLVLTRKTKRDFRIPSSLVSVSVDALLTGGKNQDEHNLRPPLDSDSIAYIIYTSGSTGRPKGVAVKHTGLVNYISWASHYYLGREKLNFPLFSTLAFDLTVTSLFVPLVSGSSVVIYPNRSEGREHLIQTVIEDNAVDIIKLTPSHLSLIQSMDCSASRVKKLIVGGEDFKSELARIIEHRFNDNVEIYNEYGPTEATVACMIHQFDCEKDTGGSIPIGKPIDNLGIYLLDDYQNPVPRGVTGQIYISGVGLAQGYVNDTEFSTRRFVDNPFQTGRKMYASGDLARWDAGDKLHYLGRCDRQVKVRGVRVELGEIESVLNGYQDIHDAMVVPLKLDKGLTEAGQEAYCKICGLTNRHPEAHLDLEGICRICRGYESQPDKAQGYFRNMDELQQILERAKAGKKGKYDCMMLLSGGKDSSYVLCKLVDLGMTPLVFTLDNGFISDGAKENMRRLVDQLGLDLHIAGTDAMNAIFIDSLKVHSNVCNGCFKTIYTLSMKLAKDLGIQTIVTGLSRGQIFETRLADLFRQNITDPAQIDRTIIEARKAYHRLDDVVARSLDVGHFKDERIFDEIQFVDFYRYCDITLDQLLDYLKHKIGWIRPKDTGRSTNCRINEAGIYVHRKERGFHNYALPYSWDVRLGHKEIDAAREELNDDIDTDNVQRILDEIGYQGKAGNLFTAEEDRLIAYYLSEQKYDVNDLKDYLSKRLPMEILPTYFSHLDQMPLTTNGKVDVQALPGPDLVRRDSEADFYPPEGTVEQQLARIWETLLRVDRVGRKDNFFDLGGDSILNIQIVALAQKQGLAITPQMIFDHPTVAQLAGVSRRLPASEIDQGPVTGDVALTPIQHRFFQTDNPQRQHYNQAVLLELVAPGVDLKVAVLQQALSVLIRHHDVLRSCFQYRSGVWSQKIRSLEDYDPLVECVDLSCEPNSQHNAIIDQVQSKVHLNFDFERGNLFHAVIFDRGEKLSKLVLLVVHHLVIDGVSWWILLDDLEMACSAIGESEPPHLPDKSNSYQSWANALLNYSDSPELMKELDFWQESADPDGPLPDDASIDKDSCQNQCHVTVALGKKETQILLQQMPARYRAQIPEMIIASLAQVLIRWKGGDALLIHVEGHGRENLFPQLDLLRTVGWFTSVFPLRLRIQPKDKPVVVLRSVKEQLRAVPNRGIGYGILRYLNRSAEVINKLSKQREPEILFNYMGQWDQILSKSSWFRFARPIMMDTATPLKPSYPIEIDAVVFEGRLQVNWKVDPKRYRHSTIQSLANDFVVAFRTLVEESESGESSGLTPSDFPDADLDQSTLDSLIRDFDEFAD